MAKWTDRYWVSRWGFEETVGECLLQDDSSVGVEAQVSAVFSDEHSYLFGNPNGTNINTAAAVMAAFYS